MGNQERTLRRLIDDIRDIHPRDRVAAIEDTFGVIPTTGKIGYVQRKAKREVIAALQYGPKEVPPEVSPFVASLRDSHDEVRARWKEPKYIERGIRVRAIREALETPRDEREADGVFVIVVGPTQGTELVTDSRVTQYKVGVLVPYENDKKWVLLQATRDELADVPQGPAPWDALREVDGLVTSQNVEIWDEGDYHIYNREIAELQSIGRLMHAVGTGSSPVEYSLEELEDMRLARIASSMETAKLIKQKFAVEANLISFKKGDINIKGVTDRNLIDFFLLDETATSDIFTTSNVYRNPLDINRLEGYKKALDEGDASQRNQDAAAILAELRRLELI